PNNGAPIVLGSGGGGGGGGGVVVGSGATDLGIQINTAYAALPTNGGHIKVLAGQYSYSTPIVFGVANKPATLECDPGVSHSQDPTSIDVTTLTFTPTSGVAITLDSGVGS